MANCLSWHSIAAWAYHILHKPTGRNHCLTGPWETPDLPYHFLGRLVRVIFHPPPTLGEGMEQLNSIPLPVEVVG